MLRRIERMGQVPFAALKRIYLRSNEDIARRDYPDRSDGLLQAEMDLYDYLSRVFFKTPGACLFLWEVSGQAVCAVRLEPFRDGLLVTGLETDPHYRGRGYATMLLSAAVGQAENTPVYSHIFRGNLASVAVHKKCGFEIIANFSTFLDGSTSTFYDTYGRNVVQY